MPVDNEIYNSSLRVLAIITARGGSKRVPRKNIRLLAGKPLITWTIEAAKSTSAKLRVLVTTDDPEIAEISRAAGADVPFLRPVELAQDDSTSVDAALNVLQWLKIHEGYIPDLVVLLQPTSPFRLSEDIDTAMVLQSDADADSVVSITESYCHLQWLRTIDKHGRIRQLGLSNVISRQHDLENLYLLNGAVYVIKTDVFLRERTFYPQDSRAYIMPPERSMDIDTELDFLIADLLMQHQLQSRRGL